MAASSSVRCEKCKKSLQKDAAIIGNLFFHPECLQCDMCSKVLEDKCHQNDSKIICQSCYNSKVASACAGCQKPITEGTITELFGKDYHEQCKPVCVRCKKPSADGQYAETSAQKPVCIDCFWIITREERQKEQEATSEQGEGTKSCEKPKTSVCPVKSPAESDKPKTTVCPPPATDKPKSTVCPPPGTEKPKACAGCQKLITEGKITELLGKAYHEQCKPVCVQCKKPSADGQYAETSDQKPVCIDCFWIITREERRKEQEATSEKPKSPVCPVKPASESEKPKTSVCPVKPAAESDKPKTSVCPVKPPPATDKPKTAVCPPPATEKPKAESSICAGCQKLITEGKITGLLGKYYHDQCTPVSCVRCENLPPDGQFSMTSDQKPVCTECFWIITREELQKQMEEGRKSCDKPKMSVCTLKSPASDKPKTVACNPTKSPVGTS